jgi:hypothetical protein
MHHFNNVGLYDALFVMQDTETKTLWNHITGEALYGSLVGRTLGPVSNLLQMNVRQALDMDPAMQIAISNRAYFAGGREFGTPGGISPRSSVGNPNAQLMPMFAQTLGKEDTRRPRMDMGLAIWTEKTRRYYPMERIRERGEAFIDQVDGKKVLIYIDPETSTPAAIFVDAKKAERKGNDVRLDNGVVVRSGILFDNKGKRQNPDRPQQIFTRWYGFALTFPGSEIFGGS